MADDKHKVYSPAPFRAIGILWLVAPLWYLIAEAIAASGFPGYSYASNYISDLGVPERGVLQGRDLDSPLHAVMNAGFIGEGVLFLLGVVLLVPYLRWRFSTIAMVVLGATHCVGIVLVGLVPGSEQNVMNGFIVWHGLGAVLAIASGNIVAIVAGRALGASRRVNLAGIALGTLGLVSGVLLSLHFVLPDGVWERASIYTFLAWQMVMACVLLRSKRAIDAPFLGVTAA